VGRFDGKVALVTGAARGQGRNHAIRLAREGADIISIDSCAGIDSVPYALATESELQATASDIAEIGRRVFSAQADVRSLDAVTSAVAAGVAELGRLDIVVANAGILSFGDTLSLTESAWRDVIDVNLTGVWTTAKAALPHIINGGRGGSVVLVSSVAGLKGFPNIGHYVAAKHGVVGLMRTLSNEFARHHIRVNTVNPTNVDTPMIQNEALWSLYLPDVEQPTAEQFREASSGMNSLPIPWVEVDDVTNAILFLVSDDARYVTGVVLPIDGGFSSKV
jgi:(+)-trans-carveol dehydrogenase